MATQITFTDDVGRIATASNVDGSIRWHVYERPFGSGTSIFVQRETPPGNLEPEVRLLNEGERPEIFFDPVAGQWVFTYVLNENVFVIYIDEFTAPATQPPQTNTTISHYRQAVSTSDDRTLQQASSQTFVGLAPGGDIILVPTVDTVAVAAGGNPGATLTIRWRATPSIQGNLNVRVAGFNVYRRGAAGATPKINSSLIPFEGFDPKIYEFDVPAEVGRYYVTQVNDDGSEGRLIPPTDTALSDGTEAADVILSVMDRKIGEAREPEDLVFTFVDATPLFILRTDTFADHGPGETQIEPSNLIEDITEFTIVDVNDGAFPIVDPFDSHGPSESFTAIIDIDNQGGVIIG